MKFLPYFLTFILLTGTAKADTPLINLFLSQDDGEWSDLLESPKVQIRVESCRIEDASTMKEIADDAAIVSAFTEYQESLVSVNLVSLTLEKIFSNEPNLISAFDSHINDYDSLYRKTLTQENFSIVISMCDELPDLLLESAETRSSFSRHMFQFVKVYASARGIENWRTILSE